VPLVGGGAQTKIVHAAGLSQVYPTLASSNSFGILLESMMKAYLDGHDALFGYPVVVNAIEHAVRLGGVFEEFAEIVA